MLYACFQTITTVTMKQGTKETTYYVSTLQYIKGCFMTDEAYAESKAAIDESAAQIKGAKERENYLVHNRGALVIYEVKLLNEESNSLSGKMLLLFVMLVTEMFTVIFLMTFTFIGIFVERFSKVNVFISSIAILVGVLCSVASVTWNTISSTYSVAFGVSTIFFVLYPILVLIFSATNKKES